MAYLGDEGYRAIMQTRVIKTTHEVRVLEREHGGTSAEAMKNYLSRVPNAAQLVSVVSGDDGSALWVLTFLEETVDA